MLTLNLFGSMSITLELAGGVEKLSLTPRLAELLVFLAIGRGRFFSRMDIARCIWETEPDSSTGTLNTALWRLRRSLTRGSVKAADFLITTPGGAIGLNGPVTMDTFTFEEYARSGLGKSTAQITPTEEQDLQRALTLYCDDVLTDFRSSWALRERERLRNIYIEIAAKLMKVNGDRGQYDEAIACGGLILAIDLPREEIQREVMRLLAVSGRRALAMRQFEICRDALSSQLGISPLPETVALYKRIAAGSYPLIDIGVSALSAMRDSVAEIQADRIRNIRGLLAEADKQLQETLEHLPQ
jgi:DNA-binding SARP family transcriptional activator